MDLEASKKDARLEILQSYQVSGVPVSSSILLPLTHIGLAALYLWFSLHLRKILDLLSHDKEVEALHRTSLRLVGQLNLPKVRNLREVHLGIGDVHW